MKHLNKFLNKDLYKTWKSSAEYIKPSLTLITFGSQADISKVTSYYRMFYDITTTGTLYYPSAYADAWNNIIVTNQSTSLFPSTWSAQPIGGQ